MEKSTENLRVIRAALAILSYFRDYPTAKDNLHGIAKWWINEEEEVTEKALALLVEEGVVEKRGQSYQLVQGKLASDSKKAIESALLEDLAKSKLEGT